MRVRFKKDEKSKLPKTMSNRHKTMKRCKSMPTIDDDVAKDVTKKAIKKVPHRSSTSKKEYMGRRSLGVAGVSSKIKRKKSKTERDRDIYDDRDIYEDEGYAASSSSSTGTYQCIPVLERSARPSTVHLSSVDSERPYIHHPHRLYSSVISSLAPPQTLNIQSLTLKLEDLGVTTDRSKLHQEITHFLKKADGEKSKQVQMTQRVLDCPQFGQTLRLIVEESGHKSYTFENILWLILKTYFSASSAGRDIMVGRKEWVEEDEKIVKARQQYMMVMDMIKDFKFELIKTDKDDFDSLNRRMEFSPDYCESLREARKKVSDILDKYDTLVDLFPNQNALWNAVHVERGKEEKTLLEGRMTSMRVWLNTLNDMTGKLKALGILFEVGSMSDGEDSWFQPLEESNKIFALEDVRGVFLEYVKKSLNLKGMKKVLNRVESILELTLIKTAILMQKPPSSYAEATASKSATLPFSQPMRDRYGEMAEWRFCNQLSLSLNLPPLTHLFFFLVAVPMQLVVHWLEIRSATEPPDSSLLDELTFDAMITDSRDCVEEAVRIKKNYLKIISSMCSKCAMPGFLYPLKYNTYVLDVFEKYIHYVKCWSNCESVRKEPTFLFSRLEMEWSSAVQCARSVKSAMEMLCNTYCDITESLIRDVVDQFSDDKIEEIKSRNFYSGESEEDEEDEDVEYIGSPKRPPFKTNHKFMLEINSLIREVKERELRVFSLLRTVLNDSYDAVGYELRPNVSVVDMVEEMIPDFCMIQFDMSSAEVAEDDDLVNLPIVLFVDRASSDKAFVESCMLAVSEGRKIDDGCVVVVPDTNHDLRRQWNGMVVRIVIDEETRICYRWLREDMIICLSNGTMRAGMEQKYSAYLKSVAPSCSSNELINLRIKQMTEDSLLPHLNEERKRITVLLSKLGSRFAQQEERALSSLGFKLEKNFLVAFQIHRDVAKIVSDSFMNSLGNQMIEMALKLIRQWIEYVQLKNSSPSPTLPMWAAPGFTFLQFITEPKWSHSDIMSDEQFNEFSSLVKQFEAKIILSASNMSTPLAPITRMTRSTSSKTSSSMLDQKKSRTERQMEKIEKLEEERNRIELEAFQIGKVVTEGDRRFVLGTDRKVVTKAPFHWALLDQIASGSFGTVHRALDIDSHRVIAAKIMVIQRENHKAIESEINIFRQLSHENLVKYYGVEVLDNEVFIFMEYCSQGTLERICHGRMDLKMVRQYTHSLLRAVQYLHAQKIIHRDIKPANIFLDKCTVLKLGDFGCSSRLVETSTVYGEFQTTAGTPQFMAPEIYSYGEKDEVTGNYSGYGRSVDIWAVGATVVNMMTGKVPWAEQNRHQIAFAVCFRKQKPTYPVIAEERKDVHDFLDACFEFDPAQRATATELLQTTFANVNVNDDHHNVPDYQSQTSKDTTPSSFFMV